MQRFILIEHAMRNLGGHYYTYATSVLEAAERAGFQPVLATHKDFAEFAAFPANWQVRAAFPRRSQWLHIVESEPSPTTPQNTPAIRWWKRWQLALRTRRRLNRTKEFANACRGLFDELSLQAGDHVLIATASDLDFYALTRFLKSNQATINATWHLQFHHALFRGRDPDYAAQFDSTLQMRTLFGQALASIPKHRVHFYCTTEELTRQYLLLGVASFTTLPYVIHSIFHRRERSDEQKSARIACLGQIRPEKGDSQLPAIINALWAEYLQPARATLLLQSSDPALRTLLDEQINTLAKHATSSNEQSPLQFATFPLSLNQYADLVHSTDVGLLLYDSAIYYARCSGLLLEMLIAGVPVIVPAGCWLAEQIHADTQDHLAALERDTNAHRRIGHNQLNWLHNSNTCALDIAPTERTLLVTFQWSSPNAPGYFIRIDVELFDAHGQLTHTYSSVLGRNQDQLTLRVIASLAANTHHVRLRWQSIWNTERIAIADVRCSTFTHVPPHGRVGLIADALEDLPEQIGNMLDNVAHYRQGAAMLGARLAQLHGGDGVVQTLTMSSNSLSRY